MTIYNGVITKRKFGKERPLSMTEERSRNYRMTVLSREDKYLLSALKGRDSLDKLKAKGK